MDNVLYGAREGTMEYPGSAAGPDAVPTYVVKYRDTVDGIASRYGVTTQSIVDRNKLQAPYALRPGQTLQVPGAKYVPPDEQVDTATPSNAPPSGPPGAVKREALPPPGASTEQKTAAASPGASGAPTPLGPTPSMPPPAPPPRFQWPLHGKVLTSYGTDSAGQKSDGIDIAASNGAPVKAADDGKVVYVGDEVARLGNLVLVEHSGGYITAYGNTEAVLVKKGDTVKKGATIARAGSSGGVASPRLHFEVRRGGAKTIDPMTVLPPS
jgi:murein DD-endopeptidase MepM/ murein hydrolase activator NlpD